jgi:hypothetical protein
LYLFRSLDLDGPSLELDVLASLYFYLC